LRLVDFKSVSFDLPVLKYRPFRAFSSNQSSGLPFQRFAGADVPYSASYSAIRRAPHDAQNPRLLQLSASLPDLAGLCFFRLTPIDSRREPHLMIAISMPLSSKIVVGWRASSPRSLAHPKPSTTSWPPARTLRPASTWFPSTSAESAASEAGAPDGFDGVEPLTSPGVQTCRPRSHGVS
jgi:hypothetical protein